METTSLRFENLVVVVTGAGNGLGKQHALFFASRGAKVVVNDLGGNIKGGRDGNNRVADVVVEEIRQAGGVAVSNYDPVQRGANIVKTAIDHFGRIDVLINNAGILRDTTLKNMKEEDWDVIMDVHIHGTMRTVRAAWPYFIRQRFGRIINTSSSSGLFGNFGQSNYAAAKMAILGFSKALALEGGHHNIFCNILAPSAASRLTATVWSPEMMEAMGPERVVPLVGALAHSTSRENGGIFLAGAGHFSKLRWERSRGLVTKEKTFSIDDILRQHDRTCDWKNIEHPEKGFAPSERRTPQLQFHDVEARSFKDKVAIVAVTDTSPPSLYAEHLTQLGTKVIVCEAQDAGSIFAVVHQGKASAAKTSDEMIQDILRSHGRIDILINNFNIQTSEKSSLEEWTEDRWIASFQQQLRSVFKLTKAVWPVFLKQKYGRVVNIIRPSGIYGESEGSCSSAASCGVIGFTKTIAREGTKYNIVANTVALRDTVHRSGASDILVLALCSEKAPAKGQLYETAPDSLAGVRWQRSGGVDFEYEDGIPSAEDVTKRLDRICDFNDGRSDNPSTPAEGSGHIHTKGTESARRIKKEGNASRL